MLTMTNKSQTERWALTVLSVAPFMAALDVFIVNVAFDDIGRDFGAPLSELSWILNGYTILYAALLVPAGRLADRYGRKGGFLVGLGLFTAASVACAASPGIWWLIAFRALQAVGAAILTPASLGLVVANALPEHRQPAAGSGLPPEPWPRPSDRRWAASSSRRPGGGCSSSTCPSGWRR